MRFVKWISLFFVDALLFFCIGFYYGFKTENFFYPGENPVSEYESPNIITQSLTPETQVSVREEVLTENTKYVVKTVYLPDTEMSNEILELPDKYVGMDRETFLMAIENMSLSPPAHEKEKGFVSAFVDSFSPTRVKVTMYYEPEEESGFYLAVFDHQVVVYEEDKVTMYMRTGISVEDLPQEIQLKLFGGISLGSEEELYNFLESYSS